jgi:hypothetical protein
MGNAAALRSMRHGAALPNSGLLRPVFEPGARRAALQTLLRAGSDERAHHVMCLRLVIFLPLRGEHVSVENARQRKSVRLVKRTQTHKGDIQMKRVHVLAQ